MAIEKIPLQRLITISIGSDGKVTHAWQQTAFSIREDGAEISRQQGDQVNKARDSQIAALQAQVQELTAARDALAERIATANRTLAPAANG